MTMKPGDLHFSLFPAGGVETASSRLRVYGLQCALERKGVQSTLGYSAGANVLLFQKKVTHETIRQARRAKARGRVVIYDVDDLGKALWYWVSKSHFLRMLRLADVVTTCSEALVAHLKSDYGVRNGVVVPNAVDYFPLAPVRVPLRQQGPFRIVWYGNSSNFVLFEKYLGTLRDVPDVEIIAVVDARSIAKFSANHPDVKFMPWSLCGMISILQSCDLACLTHEGEVEACAKGNNKMTVAITWGVPAVVSRTPEYELTAREAGVEYAVFSNEKELILAIDRLRTVTAREQYLDMAQMRIWSRYAPDVIAQQYIDLAEEAIHQRVVRRMAGRIMGWLSSFPGHALSSLLKRQSLLAVVSPSSLIQNS